MFSSNECPIHLDMFSSSECTIYLTVYVLFKWVYNMTWQCTICVKCLVQMSVQYTGEYMFNSNECTIFLTVYV